MYASADPWVRRSDSDEDSYHIANKHTSVEGVIFPYPHYLRSGGSLRCTSSRRGRTARVGRGAG